MSFHVVRLLVLLCGLSLAACQMLGARSAESLPLAPLAPASFGQTLQLDMQLQLAAADGPLMLPLVVSMDSDRCSLASLSPLGGALFSASYEQGQLVAKKAAFFRQPLEPGELLSELQWALWPLPNLMKTITDPDIEVMEYSQVRVIMYRQQPIARIQYTRQPAYTGQITFSYVRSGLRWTLQIPDYQELESAPHE